MRRENNIIKNNMSFIEILNKNINLNDKKSFFYAYTIIFMLMVFAVFAPFFYNGISLIYYGDGMEQYIITLAYFGEYIRSIIFNFLHGDFVIPMWDNSIGLGSDIIAPIHHYVICDPLAMLSAFFPLQWTEVLVAFIIIVRLYLAGLGFSLYCFKMQRQGFAILFGAFAYAFCGYNLVSIMHPLFLIPVALFPLLLLGVEKIFKKEKPYLFIIIIFISFISSFYFSYLLSVLIFVYATVRVFFIYKRDRIKNILKDALKFCSYYAIGLLSSCIIFVPSILALFASPRSSVEHIPYLFYHIGYYKIFLFSFITIFHNFIYDYYYHLKMGYPIIAMFAVVYIFVKTKEYLQLKIFFIFFILTAIFPIMGKIFNGFSYITNRWVFALSFLIAFIITDSVPRLIKITKKEIIIIAIFAACYGALFLILYDSLSIYTIELKYSFIFIAALLLLLFFLYKKPQTTTIYPPPAKALLFVLLLANISFNAYFLYSSKGWNYSQLYLKKGSAYNVMTENKQKIIKNMQDNSFFRFEQNGSNGESVLENSAMINRVNGMSYYFSLNNPFVYQYLKELEIGSERDFRWTGLDARAMTGILANSKYFIAALGNEAYIPYGYDKKYASYIDYERKPYSAYQNRNALPFGYSYDSYILRSAYDSFSGIQKQQAQMQAVVLEEALSLDFALADKIIFRDKSLPYKSQSSQNIMIRANTISVFQESGVISFQFKSLPNSETYMRLKNIVSHTPYNPQDYIYIRSPNTIKIIPLLTPWSPWYIKRTDFLINAGYNESEIEEMLLIFNPNTQVSIDNIEIISLPIDEEFEKEAAALKQDSLSSIEFLTNKIKGNINLKSNKILVLSIPYSKGWKAFVDGKQTKLLRANTAFSALPLKAGFHNIELRYTTPGILAGLALSILGLLLFLAILYKDIYKNRKRSK